MQSGGRRRVVSSCVACYRKKQKCNRRYPCNHCTRRRQPEDCIYQPSQATQASQAENRPPKDAAVDLDAQSQGTGGEEEPVGSSSDRSATRRNSTVVQANDSLAELYGYVEHSESNTMALVRKLGLGEADFQNWQRDIPQEAFEEIERTVKTLPAREIFDYLVQYYVTEVHWIDQIVYAPWFLGQYQKWWSLGRLSVVHDVEFVVLFLRICTYASQFLPSPSYTIDWIHGMALTDIRDTCHDIAGKLASICERIEARGTLLRVQHLLVLSLQCQCEGRVNAFWEALNNAVRVGQRIGLHRGRAAWTSGRFHEFDKEIRCRVFCNLYTLDSLLSRQLDCNPFIAAHLTPEHLPRMHLSPSDDDGSGHGPDSFSERLLQTQLADFWRSVSPRQRQGSEYEATEAEERYHKFCREFLANLPPAFALVDPNCTWDEQMHRLPLQRHMLHVAIFDSLCHNLRPVLLLEAGQIQSLPAYKQVLVASQRRALAAAALKMLDSVSKLHALLGRSHTRLAAIILPTFEAAVILGSLTMDVQFPGPTTANTTNQRLENEQNGHNDPLVWDSAHISRERCWRAAQEALTQLEMLAVLSTMAKASARTLTRLMAKIPPLTASSGGGSHVAHDPLLNLDQFLVAYSADTLPPLEVEWPHI